MKKILIAISIIWMCITETSFAKAPVTISGPIPAIASNYVYGSHNTVIYTITNYVPSKGFPLTVYGLSGALQRVTVPEDCGNALKPGVSQCYIGVQITPTPLNAFNYVAQTLAVNYNGRMPLMQNIAFSTSDHSNATLVAVGAYTPSNFLLAPLIVASLDGGSNWALQAVDQSPSLGIYNASTCIGSNATAMCAAVGQNYDSHNALIAVTQDGSLTWQLAAIQDNPDIGSLAAVSCTGDTSQSSCAAVGVTNSDQPLVVVTFDNGQNWQSKSVVNIPASGTFNGISCTGSAVDMVCVAVGQDTFNNRPMLAVSTDGAITWAVKEVTGMPDDGIFNAVSCVGSGVATRCFAVGNDNINAIMAVSTDGANTWTINNIQAPVESDLVSISCTDSGANTICSAVGKYIAEYPVTEQPYLIVTRDGGNTWTTPPLSLSSEDTGLLNATNCAGTGDTAICTAVGQINISPLIAVSTNGAQSWSLKSLSTSALFGQLFTTSCTKNNENAICIAAGQDNAFAPMLVMSVDGANSWNTVSIANIPSKGILYGASATG